MTIRSNRLCHVAIQPLSSSVIPSEVNDVEDNEGCQ